MGAQKNTGDSDFPYLDSGLNSGDARQRPGSGADTPALTNLQLNKFQHAGEQTWMAVYKYDFGHLGVKGPGLRSDLCQHNRNVEFGRIQIRGLLLHTLHATAPTVPRTWKPADAALSTQSFCTSRAVA
nr:OprD family outer membrane porin [Pseudomonas sp.]